MLVYLALAALLTPGVFALVRPLFMRDATPVNRYRGPVDWARKDWFS